MQVLTKQNGLLTYKGVVYQVGTTQALDEDAVHVQLYNEHVKNLYCFLISDTTINGEICATTQDFITKIKQ